MRGELHEEQQDGDDQSENGRGFGHRLTDQHGFNDIAGFLRPLGTGVVGISSDVSFTNGGPDCAKAYCQARTQEGRSIDQCCFVKNHDPGNLFDLYGDINQC